jgi:hypothetical protein
VTEVAPVRPGATAPPAGAANEAPGARPGSHVPSAAEATEHVLAGLAALRPPSAPAVPASRDDVLSLVRSLSPELLVAAVQIGARDAQSSGLGESVRGAEARAELAEKDRQLAMEQAKKAAKKATKRLGLKKFLGKLVKAVAVAAAAAAAVVTGGAASGVAVAGAALVAGADLIAKACEKMGLVDEGGARRLATALQMTGALMSAGAGLGTVAGAKAGTALVKSLSTALDVARGATQVADGSVGIAARVAQGQHGHRLANAEGAKERSEQARADTEAVVRELRDLLDTFGRVSARLQAALDAQGEARRAVTRQMA